MRRILAAAVLSIGVACSSQSGPPRAAGSTPSSPPPPVAVPTASPADPFRGSVSPIDATTAAEMTSSSWRKGCPVPLADLRLVRLTYRGFDGKTHAGELVVHEKHARAVLGVFRELFEATFPIERMERVDVYGGDDDRSMAANNTSAFNCRPSTGASDVWSQHAYGLAIDINPRQNPYVAKSGRVEPPDGASYVDRSQTASGMIRDDDVVVRAFERIGWSWGGDWSSAKDYQHFSANGL